MGSTSKMLLNSTLDAWTRLGGMWLLMLFGLRVKGVGQLDFFMATQDFKFNCSIK